jgi:hypothetical protein
MKKTIQVNPDFFKIPSSGGGRTRKNTEKKELKLNSLISPNNLKTKLLNRIKEHKTNEIKNKSNFASSSSSSSSLLPISIPIALASSSSSSSSASSSSPFASSSSDEFHGALDYLTDLTTKQKKKEFKRRVLNSRTVKNYPSPSLPHTYVSLDLPDELLEPAITTFVPESQDTYKVNYKRMTDDDDIPYGCLKNGKKKTYREWKQLNSTVDLPDIIRPPTPPKKNGTTFTNDTVTDLSREERLAKIKQKLRSMQDPETQRREQSIDDFHELEQQYSRNEPLINSSSSSPAKTLLKKTTTRKYTLGRSDKLRKVAVMIKNNQTRKNIVDTQQELKHMPLYNVKQYLRQHGMIKAGSTCPPDILRKTFETALLAGEVTNTNKETLLHNYLAEE